MRDEEDFTYSDDELHALIERYERTRSTGEACYFDEDEMGIVVDNYLYQEMFDEAGIALDLGIKIHPTAVSLQVRVAELLHEKGEREAAEAKTNELIALYPHNGLLILLKGEQLVARGKVAEAVRYFNQCLTEEIDEAYGMESLSQKMSYIFYDSGNYKEAIHFLEKAIDCNKNNSDLWHDYALCYEAIGDYRKAIETYNKALDINPYNNDVWFNLGQLYMSIEEYPKSLEAFIYAVLTNPDDTQAMLRKGHVLYITKRYDDALAAFEEYIDKVGVDAHAYVMIAECYERKGDYKTAYEMYLRGADLDCEDPDPIIGLFVCCMENGNFEEGLTHIEHAIELAPKRYEYWVYKAEAYVNLNQLDEAIGCYLIALEGNPKNADALVALGGILLVNRNDVKGALSCFLTAKEFAPQTKRLSEFLAILFFLSGDLDSAYTHLVDALSENPDCGKDFLDFCPDAIEIPSFKKLLSL